MPLALQIWLSSGPCDCTVSTEQTVQTGGYPSVRINNSISLVRQTNLLPDASFAHLLVSVTARSTLPANQLAQAAGHSGDQSFRDDPRRSDRIIIPIAAPANA